MLTTQEPHSEVPGAVPVEVAKEAVMRRIRDRFLPVVTALAGGTMVAALVLV